MAEPSWALEEAELKRLRTHTEELVRYAKEIMGLDNPEAVTCFAMGTDYLIKVYAKDEEFATIMRYAVSKMLIDGKL